METSADPWLSIIGIGEDGLDGLSPASHAALEAAEIVFGGPRHLALAGAGARGRAWPVPFSTAPVLALRGRRVAVLASGDPFWFGAGGSLARDLAAGEWRAFPAPSTFSRVAARLGWRLEETACLGLHAAPFSRLSPVLARGGRAIVLLRDADAVAALARWLDGRARVTVCEAMGGPHERLRPLDQAQDIRAPVAVALEAPARPLPLPPGIPDHHFAHDGQITKAPVRAMTLAALAPRAGAMLWDIGAGSGSVSVEWCLMGGAAQALERRADRLENIAANARRFGVEDRLTPHLGAAPDALHTLLAPDVVFIGGGGRRAVFETLFALPAPPRIVANAVTLETQALLIALHGEHGGRLMKIDLAEAGSLGPMTGWNAARTLVQWVSA